MYILSSCCWLVEGNWLVQGKEDEVMVSFDVVSLFTKIPVDLAVRVAHSRLIDNPTLEDRALLSPDEISSLLYF